MIIELNISNVIVSPELNAAQITITPVFSSGQITPEEREKLAGIEENANNYTHPETHPSSILDVVDVVNGAANKFLNERGEMVAVATSSIGVTGSPLYASTANSNVEGYKSLVGTPQTSETEIILTAKSTNGIVWGDKYLSAPFTEAITIPTTAYGFDYWRKVSAANGTSRKHLRVFLYRAGVETNIITPLASPDIDETEFTERQISYIFPELVLLAGDRIGIQEGFSTTHANNITLTYIVGDGRGWFMRLPLPLKHESLTDKNSEAAFQHIDTTITKPTLAAADMVAIKDSVTGKMVLTPKSNLQTDLTTVNQAITNLQNNKANKTQEAWITPTLLNGWTKALTDPRYMKDEFGFVHLKGRVTGGTIPSTVFTLPVGYRPAQLKYYLLNSDGYRITYCYINTIGDVIISGGATSGASFDQIMFMSNS